MHGTLRERPVVRGSELLEELGLAFRVDQPRAGRVLVLLNVRDELEPAVERVEELAIDRRDLPAEVGQVRWHVHAAQSACSWRSGRAHPILTDCSLNAETPGRGRRVIEAHNLSKDYGKKRPVDELR